VANSFGQIFEQFFGQGSDVGDTSAELWGQIRRWTSTFGRAALQKWAWQIAKREGCDHVTLRGRRCRHVAVTSCESCGQIVCLGHAFVSSDAVAVCRMCVEEIVDTEVADEEPDEQRASTPSEVVEALKVMGLGPEASWQDVTRAFRKLTAEHHPDKFSDPKRKRRAEERFKKITAAYHQLQKHFAEAA